MPEQLLDAISLAARAGGLAGDVRSRPPVFKAVGISLAVASGLFIGVSFVLKKVGLLRANVKYNEEAGEGYGYLKNFYWWAGMTLMILGEICNFVAYAFVDAILVTPLGALSVVVTTILSAIFLKERLSFVGKVGCFNCIIGSVVIAMNAPQQSSVSNIQDMKRYVIRPVFLTYAGVIIVGCTVVAIWAGPRYGKRSMFVYLSICSLIGALSVVATQGLGAAIIAQISGQQQFKEWFLYVLLGFVIITLLTEIIYLNKALNVFNAALVTPTYYVIFTSATIITSAVLFQGFKGSPISITTVVMGFLQICTGVVLLQLSKSAKDVPDAAIFKGDLDQVREVAEQEQPESEPKADAIRGTAAIIRRISTPRQKMERDEALRYQSERKLDESWSPGENEIIEWDGLRRRRTVLSAGPTATPRRTKTPRPPLGMSRFPEDDEDSEPKSRTGRSFLDSFRSRTSSGRSSRKPSEDSQSTETRMCSIELESIHDRSRKNVDGQHRYTEVKNYPATTLLEPFQYESQKRMRSGTVGSVRFADDVKTIDDSPQRQRSRSPPTPPAHRQFSFQRLFHREGSSARADISSEMSPSRDNRFLGFSNFRAHRQPPQQRRVTKNATEEEVLGLVRDGAMDTEIPHDRSRTPSPTPSILESMNEKPFGESSMSYPSRSRRSSSTSSSSSSEYHRSSDRIPSYAKGDDHLYNVVRTSAPDPFSATDQDNPAGISELRVLHNPDNERSLTAGTDNVAHPPASYQRPLVQGRDLPPIPVETTRSDGTSLFDPPQNVYTTNPNISIPPLPPDPRSIPSAPPSISSDMDSVEEEILEDHDDRDRAGSRNRGPTSLSSSNGVAFI
ncbi:hypothetical protein CPC735_054230 [Coccidioides posadasii C735 delta SOWgp]|uniref:DUF803 domain membrane protein n=1 Tax=Coccidioides posadasii (strain C735) TaxID=222929 RepID=C5PHQ0_COCP7|nr:hypothetical protein CPC735_054230 [Coccidioides posadasii C735 delta SOWgp]EER24053.1 hypothetical protein CPC735_054230 [Coccidioides posadasii C735 delta SOWgp]|eukprot:XP_003066198.1 hypothetical protein CPC735_054230 [Coccidioides posadasii C735 delta SOWgp]